jgi:DNA mismatch repair protein MutS
LAKYVKEFTTVIQQNAHASADRDRLLSLAEVATTNGYTKPGGQLNGNERYTSRMAAIPVIERQLDVSDKYVPNDVYLDDTQQQVLITTGPNMSGKSALLTSDRPHRAHGA